MRAHIRELIAKREKDLPKTEFEKILKTSIENKDVISLGPGEPDFDTPKNIRDAAKRALDRGLTHYSTTDGIKELREEISKKLKTQNKIDANPEDEIIVTTGSSEAIFLSSIILIEPDDKIIVPNPGYINYIPMTHLMGGKPISMNVLNENGFDQEIESLKKKIDDKTHVMILNSPSNPTGLVLKKKKLEEIADIVNNHNMIVFSDEAYESFVYDDNKHISIASLNGMKNRVISFFSFSKAYAMAGFRIGYAVGSSEIISAMKRIRLYSSISSPVFLQEAALEALRGPQKEIERMRREYERRGKMLHRRLCEIELFKCNKPEGAFYLFPDITELKMKSVNFAHTLLEKAKVLVVPGTEFGENGEGYVRMSYATSYDKIQEAVDRIETWIRNIK